MLNDLEALRVLSLDRNGMEELIYLSALAKSYRAEYVALNVEVPEWLDESCRSLSREINLRNADAVANRKKSIRLALDSLKTKDEKKSELLAELAALEAKGA